MKIKVSLQIELTGIDEHPEINFWVFFKNNDP